MPITKEVERNDSLLFFILIFLLLFYDSRPLAMMNGCYYPGMERTGDSSILFFILIFLLLFY